MTLIWRYAWNGANFSVLEKALAGAVAPDAAALGRFLTRWNVRALGLAPDAVDVALASLDTVIESAALDAVQ
ncbi:MAG: hypothetical protein M5R40_07875 [Anaerolineae bacterium]|nr:hypothetical protein [Anaerolineae bacterium]